MDLLNTIKDLGASLVESSTCLVLNLLEGIAYSLIEASSHVLANACNELLRTAGDVVDQIGVGVQDIFSPVFKGVCNVLKFVLNSATTSLIASPVITVPVAGALSAVEPVTLSVPALSINGVVLIPTTERVVKLADPHVGTIPANSAVFSLLDPRPVVLDPVSVFQVDISDLVSVAGIEPHGLRLVFDDSVALSDAHTLSYSCGSVVSKHVEIIFIFIMAVTESQKDQSRQAAHKQRGALSRIFLIQPE